MDTLAVTGGDGRDPLTFSPSGRTLTFTRGSGATRTTADGFEAAEVTPLGGADSVTTGDLSRTGVPRLDVDLGDAAAAPDGAVDTVGVEGTDDAEGVEAFGTGGGADVFLTGMPPAAGARRYGTASASAAGLASPASSRSDVSRWAA